MGDTEEHVRAVYLGRGGDDPDLREILESWLGCVNRRGDCVRRMYEADATGSADAAAVRAAAESCLAGALYYLTALGNSEGRCLPKAAPILGLSAEVERATAELFLLGPSRLDGPA